MRCRLWQAAESDLTSASQTTTWYKVIVKTDVFWALLMNNSEVTFEKQHMLHKRFLKGAGQGGLRGTNCEARLSE